MKKDKLIHHTNKSTPHNEALRISALFFIASFLWIIISDTIYFNFIGENTADFRLIYTYNGLVFVILTSTMIYVLVYRSMNKIIKLDRTLNIKNHILNETKNDLYKHQSLLYKVIDNSSLIIINFDLDCNITNANPYFYTLTNFTSRDVIGKNANAFFCDVCNYEFNNLREHIKSSGTISNIEVLMIDGNQEERILLLNISQLKNKTGEIEGFIAVGMDITETKQLEKTIKLLGTYDTLTGLPNRRYFEGKFENLLKTQGQNWKYALLYIDIDNFKYVNDTLGHHAGDSLLIHIAETLKGLLGNKHLISRISDDEFAIILCNVESKNEVDMIVRNIQENIKKPWEFENQKFYVSTTIGVALMPKDGNDYISLLKNANISMEYCKINNKANYCYFNEEIQRQFVDNISLLNDVKRAITNKEFTLNYQLIKEMTSEKFHSAESLIRWYHPEKGYIPPMNFIPAIEKTSLISEIRDFVINEALRQKSQWNKMGLDIPKIGINISAKSFRSEDLVSVIKNKLAEYNVGGNELILELTETGFVEDLEDVKRNIIELKRLGVEIAIDDFGTGYSSLARLKDLQIDYLKIDRTLIMNIDKDNNAKEVVISVIQMSKVLGLSVIAEGIETKEQYELLRDLGCENAQGYYIHRPAPAKELEKLA